MELSGSHAAAMVLANQWGKRRDRMSYYGITKIHFDARRNEIDEVLIHKVVRPRDDGHMFELEDGVPMAYHDVANLIRGVDTVWVMVLDDRNMQNRTDKVGIKPGQHEYLTSVDEDGRATGALLALPRYRFHDDPADG
jgi:hypothetical protein